MGFGSKDEWCGSAVKYSMFLSNFIIFVSIPMFFEIISVLLLQYYTTYNNIINYTIYNFKRIAVPFFQKTFLIILIERNCLQIGGIVLVVISVYTLYDKSFIKELLGTNLFTGAVYVLIVTGILLSFLSFLGCAGAVKEVKCMLLTVRKNT